MKKVIVWLTSLWMQVTKGYDWLRPRALKAVEVVNLVKNNLTSVADVLVAITPTKKDDELLRKAKFALEKVIPEIMAVQGLIAGNEKFEDVLPQFVEWMSKKTNSNKAIFWRELVGKLVEVLADGKVTFNEALALAMIIYSEIKK